MIAFLDKLLFIHINFVNEHIIVNLNFIILAFVQKMYKATIKFLDTSNITRLRQVEPHFVGSQGEI